MLETLPTAYCGTPQWSPSVSGGATNPLGVIPVIHIAL